MLRLYRFLNVTANFLSRHESKCVDIIGYMSMISYIPLDYFIFMPYDIAWYFKVPITLVGITVIYCILRIAFGFYTIVFGDRRGNI